VAMCDFVPHAASHDPFCPSLFLLLQPEAQHTSARACARWGFLADYPTRKPPRPTNSSLFASRPLARVAYSFGPTEHFPPLPPLGRRINKCQNPRRQPRCGAPWRPCDGNTQPNAGKVVVSRGVRFATPMSPVRISLGRTS
jgi:hypothetical protein